MQLPSPEPLSPQPEQVPRNPTISHRRPHSPTNPQAALGLSIGCFAGAGYGLSVGIGSLHPLGQKTAVVTPSAFAKPFAHDGAVVGAFCGVFAGAGFASAIAVHLGYHGSLLAALFPSHDDSLARIRNMPSSNRLFVLLRALPFRVLAGVRGGLDQAGEGIARLSWRKRRCENGCSMGEFARAGPRLGAGRLPLLEYPARVT